MRSTLVILAFAALALFGRPASAQSTQTLSICSVTLTPGGAKATGTVTVTAVQFPNFSCSTLNPQTFAFCGTGVAVSPGSMCNATIRYSSSELLALYQEMVLAAANGQSVAIFADIGANGQSQAGWATFNKL
jgi:hypothetical protein